MNLTPITLIIVVALSILLVWLITRGGIGEPARTIFMAVLAIAILFALLRLLGIY